jgi:hypothetical protein
MSNKPGRPKGLPKTGGRKKNTPNKITAAFKTALLEAFQETGGTEALVRWAKKNRTEFYKICARLIPHNFSGHRVAVAVFVPRHERVRENWLRPPG